MAEPNAVNVNVRVPAGWVARIDRLVGQMAGDPELRAVGRVSRSSVLRLAVLRGLERVEAEAEAEAVATGT